VRKRASSRWPLRLDGDTASEVRSKKLDIHLSVDPVTAAWMSDDVSWRITVCGRTAVIPLRITALYAHDGDRWVQVFEHLSLARVPEPDPSGELVGRQVATVVSPADLRDPLSSALAPILSHQTARIPSVVSCVTPDCSAPKSAVDDDDPLRLAPTLLLAPDPDGEWHGDQDASRIQLVDGKLRSEDRRIGTVARPNEASTIAYWVGNFVADLPNRPAMAAGKVRLRGSFVFEKRPLLGAKIDARACARADVDCHWVVVQGHLSQPTYDNDLASFVFGTALLSTRDDFERGKPLAVTCDDGRR